MLIGTTTKWKGTASPQLEQQSRKSAQPVNRPSKKLVWVTTYAPARRVCIVSFRLATNCWRLARGACSIFETSMPPGVLQSFHFPGIDTA